ncbi:MAG: hypothetical protein Q4D21_08970, partial [Phascolarctobacterium sp.]|nr:hypothetical protein [Phascolarctobacterium sp.]
MLDDGRTIILLNSKGKGESISPKLKNFLKYVNGEKTQGDSFIERLDAKLQEIKEGKECDMNWVSLSAQMQDERREGR